jgi:glutamate-1-semialdehyde 2,1-aminomutase
MGNCAAILPQPGFLEFVSQKCTEYGIVFILDEVKTGFRIANGGAQEFYNLRPDLATYAKALGNGYPIAAFGGKREIMSIIGHGVSQGGTYTNNKPGIAAAWATLKQLQSGPILKDLASRGQRLMDGVRQILQETGLPTCVNGYPAMFTFAIGAESLSSQRDWNATEHDLYLRIMDAMMERGVMADHDPREPWFLCAAHTDADIDRTLEVFSQAVKVAIH